MKIFNFNDNWRFFRGEMEDFKNPNLDCSDFELVHLPHTVREEIADCSGGKNYQGICWYRKEFYVPCEYEGDKIFIEFGGAKIKTDVYINGEMVYTNLGGYLPFIIDMTDYINFNEKNVITACVDNSDFEDVPPGKLQSELDSCYFGGLYRNVEVHIQNKVHITNPVYENIAAGGGIFVTYSNVSKKSADISIKTHVRNENETKISCNIKSELISSVGEVVSEVMSDAIYIEETHTFLTNMKIENPKLWDTKSPYLYTLHTVVYKDEEIVDESNIKIGIRSIKFCGDGFFLNGEHLKLNGANKHQEYVYIGDAVPDSLQYKEVLKLKEAGFNILRLGHYPMSTSFLNACDELGMMCVEPTPGWQWYIDSDEFKERSYMMTRQMIRRDRNHPCIVMWEPILNETNYTEKFAKTAYAITHEEYPTDQCYAACDSFKICSDIYDVNYGNKNNCVPKDKAIFIREYGDNYREQFGRQDTTKRVCRGWDKFYSYGEFNMLQSAIQRMVQFDRLYMHPQISGGAIWAGIDHNRGYIDNAAMVGVLDLYRLPKTSYYAYKSQRPIEEVTVLYGTYDWEVKPEELFVFSNCDEIKVTINGEETTTLKPNNAYLKQEKLLKLASNVPTSNEVLNEIQVNVVKEGLSGMPHPPFILNLPKEDIKIIEIDGIYKGNVVANQKLSKPSMAKSIVLSAEDYNMEFLADGADVIMIYAYAKDVDGNTCNTFEESVTFSIEGNGRLIGQNPINFAAGIIGILVKSTTNPGEIKVLAKCMDIVSDVLIITSIKDKTLHLPIPTQKVTKTEFVYEADKCMNDLDPNVQMFNIESEGNLAINASIVASSELSEYKACNMNDGNHGTKWVATDDTLQEILIILDKVYDIGNIKVWWDSDNTEYYYRIAVSSDGVEYETVLDKVGTGQDIKADEIHKPNIKFIKVYVDKVSKDVAGIYNIMIFEDNKA